LHILDAEVLFSDLRIRDLLDPSSAAPRTIERDHLFHRKYLDSLGISGTRQINAIANMAYVDWPPEVRNKADSPGHYLPRISEKIDPQILARQSRWHALPVGWEYMEYPTFLERRRQLIARIVRDAFNTLTGHRKRYSPVSTAELIAAGESQTTEFKSSGRWNSHIQKYDPSLGRIVIKTVCAFLNAEGGNLLIGVNDDGQVLGIEDDFTTLGTKQNTDGYELFLRQLLDDSLSAPTASTVRIRFPEVATEAIGQLSVSASGYPVFAKPVKGGTDPSEFWVRVGNATKQLHGDDLVRYQEEHWG
jgi:hypothetical protein